MRTEMKTKKLVPRSFSGVGGFTLVESLIAVAIFAILAGAIYQTSTLLIKNIGRYRENVVISSLAKQYLEIAKLGNITTAPTPKIETINGVNYQISYFVTNLGTGYNQIKVSVKNQTTNKTYDFVTNLFKQN